MVFRCSIWTCGRAYSSSYSFHRSCLRWLKSFYRISSSSVRAWIG